MRRAAYLGLLLPFVSGLAALGGDPSYTRLAAVECRVIGAATAFSGHYAAENVLQPATRSGHHGEYASKGLGVRTYLDFDFGRPVAVAALRHVQRNTVDTIAAARLLFGDAPDFARPLATVDVQHVDEPGATTFVAFPPVTARYVRWQVTKVLPGRSQNVGGRQMDFYAAGESVGEPRDLGITLQPLPILDVHAGHLQQTLRMTVENPYAQTVPAVVRLTGQEPRKVDLPFGSRTLEYTVPAGDAPQPIEVAVEAGGKTVLSRQTVLPPARKLTIYILPHSHTDIGYTAIQTDIEEKQVNNLLEGMAAARRTAGNPAGARFVWNVEVMWAVDLLLHRLSAKQADEFVAAVRSGQVALNGMYLNELTGLCRPEELMRLFRCATQLTERTGTPIDSAMISDVPGYTWGTVTAMAQAGIKYFSVAPNYLDRIGTILVEWENRPFWWIGPDGKSRVLVWIPYTGYAMSHIYGKIDDRLMHDLCASLLKRDYPYDIACVRWSGHGDNAVPDPAICDAVQAWNTAHAWPRLVIASTREAFAALEKRYGDRLPQVRGDWTPYWEDGAGSSAAETAMNRASSERLVQAETLWAMRDPARFPAARFDAAWKNVLLYSEHTWGAYCSVSEPANPFTGDQWAVKQAFATTANLQSRQLLSAAAQSGACAAGDENPAATATSEAGHFDLFNTCSWPRSEVAVVPFELSAAGAGVRDAAGGPVPAQRLANRELAVLVQDLPPLAGRRYTIAKEASPPPPRVTARGATLDGGGLHVRLDETTGAIVELLAEGIPGNLVDTSAGHALNDYLYLPGDDLAGLKRNGPVKITVREPGPLVATLRVESDAPGCHKLIRDVRLVAGGHYVELRDMVDKRRLEAASYTAKEGKESVNFAFPFAVPGGEMRLDVPLGVIRPERDQMPSACKNWLTAGRWADVSNDRNGVTWVTLDAPLVQLGGITANLLNSQCDPATWRKSIAPTQAIYSWAMNNHWHTNYRAYQEGPVTFRYVIHPHRGPGSDAAASRFAIGFSQPLVAVPGRGPAPSGAPLLTVAPPEVLIDGLKPSDDGAALIVRLLNAGNTPAAAKLKWPGAVKHVTRSDTSERPLQEVGENVPVLPWEVVTLRAAMQ